MALRTSDIPERLPFRKYYPNTLEWINGGDSAILGPEGNFLAGPLHEQEGILYAEIDPRQARGPKWMLDVAGHYSRPDIFQLTVRLNENPVLRVENSAPEAP